MPAAAVRKLKSKGALISLITTIGLIAALVATLLGTGFFNTVVATHDGSSWLWTITSGELAKANGETGRVDTRHEVTDSKGHSVEIVQTETQILLRDLDTGKVNAIDPATLQITGTADTPPGEGVTIALHDGVAFIVDTVQGIVHQVDASTLAPQGEPLRFAAGLTGGIFDNDGKLWFAVPKEGTLNSITPGENGAGATVTKTVGVAEPSHELLISVLRDGVAVLDTTGARLTTLHGDEISNIDVPLDGVAVMPASTDSSIATITVTDGRRIYAIDGTTITEYDVPGEGGELGAAQEWWGRIYVADNATDEVYVFDKSGALVDTIKIPAGRGPIEMEARDGFLFVNAPGSNDARIIDDKHGVKEIDKAVGGVVGADVPPEEKKEEKKEEKDEESAPGAPRNLTARAGNGSVTVSWDPAPNNGAAITRYVIESDKGETYEVAGDQRVRKITGLENGTQYRFTVYAVNKIGDGDKATSNPVMPTAEVPDPPASVTAEAKPDGTVVVTWPAADGQGHTISGYEVDAIGAGGSTQPAGRSNEPTLTVESGKLTYGEQYAFTVTAVSESGAASDPSPQSATIVPFTTPEAPPNLVAQTDPNNKGTVNASWSIPEDNGRAITGYKVTANGSSQTVTGTNATINGLADGQTVEVQVVAINEAGEGKPSKTTAQAIKRPTVSITGSSATTNSVTVTFSADDGNGTLTCTATAGGKSASGCNGSLTINGLNTSTAYTIEVTVTNKAGSAKDTKNQSTGTLAGTIRCQNYGSGDTATYCDPGITIYDCAHQENCSRTDKLPSGTKRDAVCKVQGQEIYAYGYNNNKRSTWWIKINNGGGNDYIPWAWFNLDQGDNLDLLSTC